MVMEIVEVGDEGLERFVAAMQRGRDHVDTAEGYRDWKRQARETIWLVAVVEGMDVAAAIGVGGWHEPEGVARGDMGVEPDRRRQGIGTALLAALGSWAHELGYRELLGAVRETDPPSIEWATRRGFLEVGRNSTLVLDLTRLEPPAANPPPGVEIVTWAERPELTQAMYVVACETYPDVPGSEDDEMPELETWLSMDMQGAGDRPEATFVALSGEEVVAYAKLSLSLARPHVAMHDITGVRRAWRGRGIAGALKRAEIAWAVANGYERLETQNEERNEPIRRLNEKHGYIVEPGSITLRGAIPSDA